MRGAPALNDATCQELRHFIERYHGQRVALLTQHGKEALLGPIFSEALGCKIEHIVGYDTDTLGTFTRDIPRDGSQLDAARRKARIGTELGLCPLGLASEGAFGADPFTGFMSWDAEMVLWLDIERNIELVGFAEGPARNAHSKIKDWAAMREFSERAGFPAHQLVIRPNDENDPRIHKGIADWRALEKAFNDAARCSELGIVFVENDLRAHCNPTRQVLIQRAGLNLIERMRSPCPSCQMPGFWVSGHIGGLPCQLCLQPTREAIAEVWSCTQCAHHEERKRTVAAFADPSHCEGCNP